MSFAKLPDHVLGRIGDFLTPLDRARMRETSRENYAIYRKMPAHEYLVRNRFSLIKVKSGTIVKTITSESKLQQNIFSSEIGTKNQRENSLQKTNFFNLVRDLELEEPLFGFLTDGAPPPPGLNNIYNPGSWSTVKDYIVFYLFRKVVLSETKVEFDRNYHFSLFSQSELGDNIQQRKSFPVTFVKVKKINLLDYASIIIDRLDKNVTTIDNLVKFFSTLSLPGGDYLTLNLLQWLKNILILFLGGDGTTSIEPLKEFFSFSYIHEVNVVRHKLS